MSLVSKLNAQFIVPVIRETEVQNLESICLALADGGLSILEVTLMSDAALTVIKKLSVQKNLMIGAGTVLSATQAQKAMDAGAQFLVSPGLNVEALKLAQKNKIPFFPGVLTPTEIMQAQAEGCELVKIFPISNVGGSSYLKSLQGPFPSMKWMVTGGVSLNNLKEYRTAGATCVGLGGNLVPADKIKSKDWSGLQKLAEQHRAEIQSGGKL